MFASKTNSRFSSKKNYRRKINKFGKVKSAHDLPAEISNKNTNLQRKTEKRIQICVVLYFWSVSKLRVSGSPLKPFGEEIIVRWLWSLISEGTGICRKTYLPMEIYFSSLKDKITDKMCFATKALSDKKFNMFWKHGPVTPVCLICNPT